MERLFIEGFEDGNIAVTKQRLTSARKITGDIRKQEQGSIWQRIERTIVRPGKPVQENVSYLFQSGQNQEDVVQNERVAFEGRLVAENARVRAEIFDRDFKIEPAKKIRVVLIEEDENVKDESEVRQDSVQGLRRYEMYRLPDCQ